MTARRRFDAPQAASGRPARRGARWWGPAIGLAGAVAALTLVVLAVTGDDGDPSGVAGPGTTEPDAAPGVGHEGCGVLPTEGPEADDALRSHLFRDLFRGSPPDDPPSTPADPVVSGAVVVGDFLRGPDRVEICVRTYWASDPVSGSGDFMGHSDDVAVLERDADAWQVSTMRRGPLVVAGEFSTADVALLADENECGTRDADFVLVPRAVVLEGDDPLTTALRDLFGGASGVGEEQWTALPADSRLLSVSLENGVARVDVSAATEHGGGSCLMNQRIGQIRRTALAHPDVGEVVISVEGRTEGIFQP